MAVAPIMIKILNTAEPRIVPIPTSESDKKTPMKEVASSGAEEPAAMKVAPATSGLKLRPNGEQMSSSENTKPPSQIMATPRNK